MSDNLEWLTWTGSLPNGAVAIYNDYAKRTDYVCKYGCDAGFYNPSLGSHCHYPLGNRELTSSRFEILVNKDNFEFLEWKAGSYGSVPPHSVETCPGSGVYVGKNKYGLGKVHAKHKAFFLPWEGAEHWYKSYEVLTINRDAYSQHISDVKYFIDQVQILKNPPETMHISAAINNGCQNVLKTVKLAKATTVENSWNMDRSTMLGVASTVTAQVPVIGSTSIELKAEVTKTISRGTTTAETSSHSVEVQVTIPPNHSCTVRMEGRKMKADIPYTARLSRTYCSGEIRSISITGTYNGVSMGEVRAVIERCKPLDNAKPCP